jgi:hypothetical protein
MIVRLDCVANFMVKANHWTPKKAGWSWGCVSAIDREGRTIWIADAHGDDGRRFVVRADEILSAFVELESAQNPTTKLVKRDSSQFRSNSLGGNRHKNRN